MPEELWALRRDEDAHEISAGEVFDFYTDNFGNLSDRWVCQFTRRPRLVFNVQWEIDQVCRLAYNTDAASAGFEVVRIR